MMIRFSAQGAYLLLLPPGRTIIREKALISFGETDKCSKHIFFIFFCKGTITETVIVANTPLMFNVRKF